MNGDNLLDVLVVYLEIYLLVQCIVVDIECDICLLIGDLVFFKCFDLKKFIDEIFGLLIVIDIFKEFDKFGCDLCLEFKIVEFQEGVESFKDFKLGMVLEGVVINVINFGVFVDIGVYQDGLVYILVLFEKFVKDLYEVVKVGDIVKVKVMEVDILCNCVGLFMCMSDIFGEKVEGQCGGCFIGSGQLCQECGVLCGQSVLLVNNVMVVLFVNVK